MTDSVAESYRGYRLTSVEGTIDISQGGEHIDWSATVSDAKALIDQWVDQYQR